MSILGNRSTERRDANCSAYSWFGGRWREAIGFAVALVAVSCLIAQAGPFSFLPKLMKHFPEVLRGEYRLFVRMNPDNTKEQFTNAPPFATILSDRVVLTNGQSRLVEGVIRLRQKGTNVYMVSFQDKSSWIITQAPASPSLVILEPKGKDSSDATMFIVCPNSAGGSVTNVPRPEPDDAKHTNDFPRKGP